MPKGATLKDLRAKYVAACAERFGKAYDAHVAMLNEGAANADEILGF